MHAWLHQQDLCSSHHPPSQVWVSSNSPELRVASDLAGDGHNAIACGWEAVFRERQQTCKLFRNVLGVSHEVLPIKISRPNLALSLCATRISLRVTPPTTKATMRLPCRHTHAQFIFAAHLRGSYLLTCGRWLQRKEGKGRGGVEGRGAAEGGTWGWQAGAMGGKGAALLASLAIHVSVIHVIACPATWTHA